MMSKIVNWGVLGCAGIARGSFIPAVKGSERGRVYAIASRDQAKADAWANEHGFEKAYGSYEALLADDQVDAVYVPTPNTLHAEWVVKAAEAGKAIFCEKPLAADADEAATMVAAAERAGVLFLEAFVFRYHPQSALVRGLLDAGRIGQVRSVQTRFNYQLRGESRKHNIRTSQPLKGGALMDVGCYCINGARFIYGEEPEAISCRTIVDPEFGVDTTASALMIFPGGRAASFTVSMDMPGGQSLTAYGTEGELRLQTPFHPRGDGAVVEIAGSKQNERIQAEAAKHPFTYTVDHFADCLLDGQTPLLTAADGVKIMRVIDACMRSAASGETVRL